MKKLMPLLSLLLIISCSRPKTDDSDTVGEYIPELDTATSLIDTVPPTDTVKVEPADYTEAEYQDGILPVIAAEAPIREETGSRGPEGIPDMRQGTYESDTV